MSMKRLLVIFFCVVFLLIHVVVHAAGSTGKITGAIVDAETGEALAGANVIIVGTHIGASTDSKGRYFILNLWPGVYDVKIMYIGYGPQVKSLVRVVIDRTTTVDFSLKPETIEGEKILVTAHRSKMVEPDRTSTKQIYLTEEIENIEGMDNVQDVINLQADVVDNHYRGGRLGETNYYINGASIVNPITNNASFQPMIAALQQVEVITSGFSAEYGNAQSGVVNMVMKKGGNRWRTLFTAETDLPRYRHWGASVYSPEVRQYDNLLRDVDTWKNNPKEFGIDESERLYQRGGGSEFKPSQFAFSGRNASKELAFLALQEYLLSANEIGRNYKNALDTRYELTVNGPITKNIRLFLAGQLKQVQNKVPYYLPNDKFQVLGNLTYESGKSNSFSLQFMQSKDFKFSNYNSQSPYYSYGLTNTESNIMQTSLKWQHIISPMSFFNVSTGYFKAGSNTRAPLTAKGEPQGDYFISLYKIISGPRYPYVTSKYGLKESEVYNISADYTSQINYYNLIKTGLQFNYTHIYSDFTTSSNGSSLNPERISPKDQVFDHYPYDGALYIQDKIEYQGIIVNAGLRWDFYNFNTDAFSDVVSPTRNPDFISLNETPDEKYYNEDQAIKEKTKLISRLAPRLGISFPIGETAVFHVNYGEFVQRPELTQIYQRNRILTGESVIYDFLGNPNLKPEETSAYDIGVVFGLPLHFTLDMSAYQKSVKNLLTFGTYIDEQQKDYVTTINRDYANIEGFHINLEKTGKHLEIFLRYNWQQATGKSEGGREDGTQFVETTKYGSLTTSTTVQPEDEFMDYDRTHRLVANFRLKTGQSNLFGLSLFNDISLSTTYRFMTGRPFTYDPGGENLIKNKRTREDHNLSMRLLKDFSFSGVAFSFYADVFNILNFKQLSFGYLSGNVRNTEKYFSHSPYYSRNDLHLGDFWWDNSLSAYSNQPRHCRIGLQVNL